MSRTFKEIFHYWLLSIIPKNSDGTNQSGPAYGGVICRGEEYDGAVTIDTTEDKANLGTRTTVISKDRTSASSEPTWNQNLRFGEIFEDFAYLLLGKESHETLKSYVDGQDSTGADINRKVVKWVFEQDIQANTQLPNCTLINGYAGVSSDANDARVYDNCILSEFNISIDSDGIKVEPTFASDVPVINQPNPAKVMNDQFTKVGLKNVHFYIADYGTNLLEKYHDGEDLSSYEYECLRSLDTTYNNNVTQDDCVGADFGKNNGDAGDFTSDSTVEFKWNPKSQLLLDKWYTSVTYGTEISTDSYYAETLLVLTGKELTKDGDTTYTEQFVIYEPKVDVEDVSTPESGEDTKTITAKWGVTDNGGVSPVLIEVISNLEDLHYGTVPTGTKYLSTGSDKTTLIDGSVRKANTTTSP